MHRGPIGRTNWAGIARGRRDRLPQDGGLGFHDSRRALRQRSDQGPCDRQRPKRASRGCGAGHPPSQRSDRAGRHRCLWHRRGGNRKTVRRGRIVALARSCLGSGRADQCRGDGGDGHRAGQGRVPGRRQIATHDQRQDPPARCCSRDRRHGRDGFQQGAPVMTRAAIENYPGLLLNPLPLSHASIFDAIRDDDRIQWVPYLRAWLVTGHEECAKLLRHPAAKEYSSADLWRKLDGIAGIDSGATLKALSYFPFWLSGAEHRRQRGALTEIAKTLYGEIADRASLLAQAYVEEARSAGGFDFAQGFANRLYSDAVFHALGIDPDKRAALRQTRELAAI